jgi:hypothetical protein
MKKHFIAALGIGAFVIGGIIAREKTLEMAETLEKVFSKKPEEQIEQ